MPKRVPELTALEVARLRRPGLHMVGGVSGLALRIGHEAASKSWILRYSFEGRRRDKGLGSFPEIGLARARDRAREARESLALGQDPISAAKAAKSAAVAARASEKTFAEFARTYVDAMAPKWTNAKHVEQWTSTLRDYAGPVIGDLLLRDVALPHILAILEPIWLTKTETASRLRGRLESILDAAIARQLREGPNPARWKGNLQAILPAPNKVAKAEHYASLPPAEVPGFLRDLRAIQGVSARALEFSILCASRSGEVRLATWAEIDLAGARWSIPGARMKAKKPHVVPLSTAALELLRSLPRGEPAELIFPSPRNKPLSDMAMTALVRRMGAACVPHGFRSSFRVWCAESTSVPREVAEAALAHVVENATEAAYQRSSLYDKRVPLMEQWGRFCTQIPGANVTPIRSKGGKRPPA